MDDFVILLFWQENVSRSFSQCSVTRPVRQRFAVSSADADPSSVLPKEPVRPQRTLINPFKPNQIPCNRTCNKHRWSQVFATGPDGEILLRHYHKLAPANDETEKTEKPEKVSVLWNSRGWFKYMIRFWGGEKLEYPKENYWVDVVHAQYSCIMNFSLLRAGVTGCQSERTPFAAVGSGPGFV